MDQEELTNKIQDAVLVLLPEEGINELAAAYEEGKTDNDVKEILVKYGVDINKVAQDIVRKKGQNE